MDFIEQMFGVFPDGGSGLFEFLLFLVPATGIALLTRWRRSLRAKSRPR